MKENSIKKELTGYISFNVLGMLGLSCYILADTFFVAKGMGTKGLTALNLAIAVYSFIHGTGLMLGIGGATKYTILHAQNKAAEADRVFTNTVLLGLAAGIIFLGIGLVASGSLSKLLGADQETYALTNVYLKTLLCFSPCFILNNVMLAFVRNDGGPNLAMAGMVGGSLSNVVLDYLFVFPLGMGMFGAALATGIAPLISLSMLSVHKLKQKNKFHFNWSGWKLRTSIGVVQLGVSAFINEFSSGVALITFNLLILGLAGNIGVAAYGIVANISLVMLSVFTGIGQGLQPVVSRTYGKGDIKASQGVLKHVIMLSLLIAVVLYGMVSLLAKPITGIFNAEQNQVLANYAVKGIRLYFIGIFFAGLNIVAAAFLSAVEWARQAFFVSIMRGCAVLLPMAFILASCFGMNGVWAAFPAAEFLTCVVSITCFLKFMKSGK